MIQKSERKRYASDLSDRQWAILAPLFPPAGNKSTWEKRELVDAVLYLVDNGCKWRNLSHDFQPYTTVANFYYAAIKSGLWEKIQAALVDSRELGLKVDISARIKPEWEVLPKRWIVERSLPSLTIPDVFLKTLKFLLILLKLCALFRLSTLY